MIIKNIVLCEAMAWVLQITKSILREENSYKSFFLPRFTGFNLCDSFLFVNKFFSDSFLKRKKYVKNLYFIACFIFISLVDFTFRNKIAYFVL